MSSVPILVCLCTLLSLCLSQQAQQSFSKYATLDPDGHFQIFWSSDNDTITIQYHAMSKGWAGLGFSPNGAMTGADIALFWIDPSGNGFVSDRHASHNGFPQEDKHQDYTLLEAMKNGTHIIVTFTRKRITCDTDDWPLTDDTTRVIYAANDKVPEDKNTFDKHTVRGSKSLYFFQDRPNSPDGVPPEANATFIEFRVNNVKVPDNRDTLYYCEFLPIPKLPTKKHIIKMEPIIQHENVDVVHHLLVYMCGNFNASKFVGQGAPCFDNQEEITKAFGKCQTTVLSAWAVGGESITYPDDIGVPLYNPNDDMYVMIEMHYDNSEYKKGRIDSSGMRLWLTDNIRPIDAGPAAFGIDVGFQILPPGVGEIINYGYCSAKCTKDFPEEGVKIIGGLLHTHLAGRKIRLLHYRDGVQLPNVFNDEYYDFNYQNYRRLKEPVTILPGDELVVECVYNTDGRNTTTLGGIATHDEMCLVFAEYYPAAYSGFACLSSPDRKELMTAFDRYDPKNETIESCTNHSLYECIKDYDWSQGEINRIKDIQRNGKHNAICLTQNFNETAGPNSTKPVIQIYEEHGYVNVTKPLVPQDVCKKNKATSYGTNIAATGVLFVLTLLAQTFM